MTAAADRHLLFGLRALQNGLISQVQLVAAFQAWTLDKSKSLADHLEARGDLTGAKRALLEGLAEVHVEANGGDVEKSLAAVSAGKATRESLALIGDPEIAATLGHIASPHVSTEDGDGDRTTSYAVGSATSDGQRFRILRPHAKGGLGAVFVALDGELNREVALKQILDQHADDPTSRKRFVIEAQITGGLEHPGIVPVYGLGSYGDGRPYYAMRFIKGDSLKEALEHFHGEPGRVSAGSPSKARSAKTRGADASPLAFRQLLRRFLDVCNAVGYAHSRGVLHRDIKPGNVIVGKHGETLVVDWGLAKATGKTEPGALERTLLPSSTSGSAETLPGSALGTPAYMSPEQACGDLERLGPQSDVYSLGATLYCLLTGRPPFEGDDIGEVLRKVQRGEFARPRQLDPAINWALEAVCLKALALEPEDRYATPRALADDVERWAADEPVTAYQEPWAVRAGRWARRHRPLVAGAVALLATAVVALSVGTALLRRANTETDRQRRLALENLGQARTNLAQAEANFRLARDSVDRYLTRVSEDRLLNEPGMDRLRRDLLASAREFYQGFVDQRGTDPLLRAELARARLRLARVDSQLGSRNSALRQVREAIAAFERLSREDPENPEYRADLGSGHGYLGSWLQDLGRLVEAEAESRQAVEV